MGDPPNTRRFDAGKTEVLTAPASTTTAAPAERWPSGPIERYVAGAEIARGGMGRVMAGTDTRLGREIAIKEALPQGGDLERFEREVRITARLEHPSIVPLYDAGVTEAGRPFYVMRKVSGQPLERLIAERTPAEPGLGPRPRPRRAADQRLALLPHVLAAARALGHAHRRGVIHRDVKPANILVGELGETVVIDWGLAKVIGEDDAGPAPRIDGSLAPSGGSRPNATQMRPLHDLGNRWLELPHMWSNRETWQGDIAIAGDSLQLIGPTHRALLSPVHDSFVAVAGRRDARYLAVH